jgi:hypothetical protein
MLPRLVTLLMVGLFILGAAGQSWAQLTRTYSNPMNFTTNQPSDQNFGARGNTPWNSLTPTPGGKTYQNYHNPWVSGNSGPSLGIQVSPTVRTPWGSTTFGSGGPGNN